MYTKGTGSGHLSRINAVYRGFVKAGYQVSFHASLHRSRYKAFLDTGIRPWPLTRFPRSIDIWICDWRSDHYVDALPANLATLWVGLRRLGKMPARFPERFHVVAIEPGVAGDSCIWPIIATFREDLKTSTDLRRLLGRRRPRRVALLCENGAYPKHVEKIFRVRPGRQFHIVRCSNSPFADSTRDLNYYPIAEFFRAADLVIIGGGYNSVHEARCYADPDSTEIVHVGGDDQALRISRYQRWEPRLTSQADVLAHHLVARWRDRTKRPPRQARRRKTIAATADTAAAKRPSGR